MDGKGCSTATTSLLNYFPIKGIFSNFTTCFTTAHCARYLSYKSISLRRNHSSKALLFFGHRHTPLRSSRPFFYLPAHTTYATYIIGTVLHFISELFPLFHSRHPRLSTLHIYMKALLLFYTLIQHISHSLHPSRTPPSTTTFNLASTKKIVRHTSTFSSRQFHI